MGLGPIGEYSQCEWVNHLDGFFCRLSQLLGQTFGITCHGLWMKHRAFEAKLDVLGGQRFSIVEGQTLSKVECPTIAVGINPPFFGDAWTDPAILGFVVKAQQGVIDRSLVLGMTSPALQDRVRYLCAQVFKAYGQGAGWPPGPPLEPV